MNESPEAEVEAEEFEEEWNEPREDFTFFCALRMKKVLVVSQVCFCRIHGSDCRQCIYDVSSTGRILARVIRVLADALNRQRSEK